MASPFRPPAWLPALALCMLSVALSGEARGQGTPAWPGLAQSTRCEHDFHCFRGFCDRGRCRERKGEGERCVHYNECASDFCNRGRCEARREEGGQCSDNTHCAEGLYCDGRRCRPQRPSRRR